MKRIKNKGPSGSAIQRLAQRDVRHVANSKGLTPVEVEKLGNAVIAHRESELFHAVVPQGLLLSPELDTMREVARQAIEDFDATGIVSEQLLAIAMEAQKRDVSPETRAAGAKVITLAAQQKGKPAPSQAEFASRPRVDTTPPTNEREVASRLATHAKTGGNLGISRKDFVSRGRNVDLVRDSDGKRIADDETVALKDGEKFHTEPRVELGVRETTPLSVAAMSTDDDIKRAILEEKVDSIAREKADAEEALARVKKAEFASAAFSEFSHFEKLKREVDATLETLHPEARARVIDEAVERAHDKSNPLVGLTATEKARVASDRARNHDASRVRREIEEAIARTPGASEAADKLGGALTEAWNAGKAPMIVQPGVAPGDVRHNVTIPVPDHLKDHPAPALAMAQALGILPGGSPGKRVDHNEPDKTDPVEGAVEWFSWLMPSIQRIAREKDPRHALSAAGARLAWPHLNNARVFAIPQATYQAVFSWADRITSEEVAGFDDWNPDTFKIKPEDAEHYNATVREAARHRPFPEHLPFDDVMLIYGTGIGIEHALSDFIPDKSTFKNIDTDVEDATLIGHLLSASGDVWEFIVGTHEGRPEGNGAIFFHQIRTKGEWTASVSLMAWVVPAVVDLVNSFKALVREQPRGLSMRRKWEKDRRHNEQAFKVPGKKIPPPFYRVELRHELVEERLKEHTKRYRSWKLDHRVDVRSHERVRVMRGKLPLEPKLEVQLLRRGYKVFSAIPPPSDDPAWRLIAERHERPKAQDEWLAIKVSWVRAYIRGPEGTPYVPAVRTLPAIEKS